MIADHMFKWDPPWTPIPGPLYPSLPAPWPLYPPTIPPEPHPEWPLNRLIDLLDLLERVKALEEKVGCPCDEPGKPDYITLLKERIEALEKKVSDDNDSHCNSRCDCNRGDSLCDPSS